MSTRDNRIAGNFVVESMNELLEKMAFVNIEPREPYWTGDFIFEKEQKEIQILQKYQPKQLSHDELKSIVQEVIKSVGAASKTEIGKVMKELMPKVKDMADGREVNQIVSELLV